MDSIKTVTQWGIIRYKNEKGQFHRIDGPAYEDINGYKAWIINGIYHREDGPAYEEPNGEGFYYLNDKRYSKEEWEVQVIKLKLKRILDL
jgi:hypothetical protein